MADFKAVMLVTEEAFHSDTPQLICRHKGTYDVIRKLYTDKFQEIWGFPLHDILDITTAHRVSYEYVEGDSLRYVDFISPNSGEAPNTYSLSLLRLQELADTYKLAGL